MKVLRCAGGSCCNIKGIIWGRRASNPVTDPGVDVGAWLTVGSGAGPVGVAPLWYTVVSSAVVEVLRFLVV